MVRTNRQTNGGQNRTSAAASERGNESTGIANGGAAIADNLRRVMYWPAAGDDDDDGDVVLWLDDGHYVRYSWYPIRLPPLVNVHGRAMEGKKRSGVVRLQALLYYAIALCVVYMDVKTKILSYFTFLFVVFLTFLPGYTMLARYILSSCVHPSSVRHTPVLHENG